jgi:hypothetical protein
MAIDHELSDLAFERMFRAVEKVRDRLQRSTQALTAAGVPYAVVGGNAVAAWVGDVDEAAVRNTQDVDILLRRDDLERAKQALESVGFLYRHSSGIDMFLDGPDSKDRDAVHIVFAKERVRSNYLFPAPDVTQSKPGKIAQVIDLESLLKMKLTSFRDKDRMHIRDLIGVELVDQTWLSRVPQELAERLKIILDNPEG